MMDYKNKVDIILKDDRLLPEQRFEMKKFVNDFVQNNNNKYRTCFNRLNEMRRLCLVIRKPFLEMDSSDLQDYFYNEHTIGKKTLDFTELETSSVNEYKMSHKVFFEFLKHTEPISWFKFPKVKNIKTSDEMLSMEEIELLIEHAGSERNRAIIALFYDSAIRCGEMYHLKYRNIHKEKAYGMVIHVEEGKTGQREIILNSSAKYILQYMNSHKTKKPSDPLWMTSTGLQLSQKQISSVVTDAAVSCGMMERYVKGEEPNHKKVVYPHLFRHTRLTHLCTMTGINESLLRAFAGWSASSKMPETYIHMSPKQIHLGILTAQGIEIKEENPEKYELKEWVCSLEHKNGITNAFCYVCGEQKDRPVVKQEFKITDELIAEIAKRVSEQSPHTPANPMSILMAQRNK